MVYPFLNEETEDYDAGGLHDYEDYKRMTTRDNTPDRGAYHFSKQLFNKPKTNTMAGYRYQNGDNFRPYNGSNFQQGGRSFQRRSYGAPYNPGFGRGQGTGKKRTGAKFKTDKNGNPVVVAWNAGKQGLRTLIASPISDAGLKAIAKVKGQDASEWQFEGTTKTGKRFQRWFYKMVNKTTGEVFQGRAFFHPESKKLYLPRFNMVASCGRDYFGTSRRPKGQGAY